jgi:GTPase SAR1 family protein
MSEGITTTILGQSNSGKTCYLVALYRLMRAGINVGNSQLVLSTDQIEKENRLIREYDALKQKSRWPDPTSNTVEEYNFLMIKDLKRKYPFTWIDYTGGVLAGTEGSLESYETIAKRIKTEFGSVLFVLDGKSFKKPIPSDEFDLVDFKIENGYDKFNALMSEYIVKQNEYGRPPIIVLLITKYDLCRDERKFDDIVGDIRKLFPALFLQKESKDKRSPRVVGIIPVSLGDLISEQKETKFKVKPFQIHLPLIFILWKQTEYYKEFFQELESLLNDAIKKEDTSWIGQLTDKFNMNQVKNLAKRELEELRPKKEFLVSFEETFADVIKNAKLLTYEDFDGYHYPINKEDKEEYE